MIKEWYLSLTCPKSSHLLFRLSLCYLLFHCTLLAFFSICSSGDLLSLVSMKTNTLLFFWHIQVSVEWFSKIIFVFEKVNLHIFIVIWICTLCVCIIGLYYRSMIIIYKLLPVLKTVRFDLSSFSVSLFASCQFDIILSAKFVSYSAIIYSFCLS